MFVIMAVYLMVMIAIGVVAYTKGYAAGEKYGAQTERAKYRDEINIETKQTVVD